MEKGVQINILNNVILIYHFLGSYLLQYPFLTLLLKCQWKQMMMKPVVVEHAHLQPDTSLYTSLLILTHLTLTKRCLCVQGAAVMQLLQGGAGCALGPGAPS